MSKLNKYFTPRVTWPKLLRIPILLGCLFIGTGYGLLNFRKLFQKQLEEGRTKHLVIGEQLAKTTELNKSKSKNDQSCREQSNGGFKMMGSTRMAIQLPLLLSAILALPCYLQTESGRRRFMKYTGNHDPNQTNLPGFARKRANFEEYYDELDKLRKVNVVNVEENEKYAKPK